MIHLRGGAAVYVKMFRCKRLLLMYICSYVFALIYLQWQRCCCYIRVGALDSGPVPLPEFRCKLVKTGQN